MLFWVPQSGDIGLGVSILSYNGGVQFGVITDTELCDEPQHIIDGFEPEFNKLVYTLSLLPQEMFGSNVDANEIEAALFQ
jgi:diacylglycerol O-acyltransferase / wax synthase